MRGSKLEAVRRASVARGEASGDAFALVMGRGVAIGSVAAVEKVEEDVVRAQVGKGVMGA